MIYTRDILAEQYAAALEEYLADGEETALHAAYELGRRAIADGVGVLEILAIHNSLLGAHSAETDSGNYFVQLAERASSFLAECLSPFEMILRGFRETNTSLRNSLDQIQTVEKELQRQNQELLEIHQTLVTERQRYQDLFDFAPDAYIVTDRNGRIESANSPAVQLLQSSAELLAGQTLFSFVVAKERIFFNAQLARLQSGQEEKLEFWRVGILQSDGLPIPVSITVASVRDARGMLTGLRCLLRDITERQRLEEDRAQLRIREHLMRAQIETAKRFKLLAEISHSLVSSLNYSSIPDIIALLSGSQFGDQCFVYLTDESMGVEYFAASRADRNKAEIIRSLDFRPTPAELPPALAEVLRNGKPEVFAQVSANWLNPFHQAIGISQGGDPPNNMSALLVPLIAHGNRLGAIAFIASQRPHTSDDLALAEELARRCALAVENARLYQQMVIERDKAEKASQTKEKFVAILSHELRTPLMVILGWARLLSRQAAIAQSTVFAEGVRSLEHNAQTLNRLVEDCLDTVRISEGKIRLRTEVIDLNRVASSAFEVTRKLASEKGLRFASQLSAETLPVSGDQTRLEQVLLNLLTNAIRFTPSGGEVNLLLSRVDDEAEIVVEDTGVGIDPKSLKNIFRPFHQATVNWLSSGSGLGLGLAIANEIVELHGGQIWAESPGEGSGSTFRVRLPLAAVEAIKVAPRTDFVLPKLKSLRVLFVEDSKDIQVLFQLELEALGCTVFTAGDGESGFEIAQRVLPNLIVSDIKMPRCDGYEMIKRIRRVPELAEVPAIAMTGFGVARDIDAALGAGYNAHLCKPVELEDLVALMEKLT